MLIKDLSSSGFYLQRHASCDQGLWADLQLETWSGLSNEMGQALHINIRGYKQ